MAGRFNLKLRAHFFNKIGSQASIDASGSDFRYWLNADICLRCDI
jgi:hypothetical protein